MNISRNLKHFNYIDELVSIERPIKEHGLTEHTRISSYHEWIRSAIILYKLSATLKVTYQLWQYTNVDIVNYLQYNNFGYWY